MVNCCVPYCSSYSRRTGKFREQEGEYVSYHEFPVDPILQADWLKVISRKDFAINFNSNSSRVCSKHFREEDFLPKKNGRRLKKGSVPSVFKEYPAYMQPSAPSPKRREPKQRTLDSSEEMGSVPSVFKEYPVSMQPSASSPKHSEPKQRTLDSSEEMGSVPSVFKEYPVSMQPSASSPKHSEPKQETSDSSEEMMEECGYILPSLSVNESIYSEPTTDIDVLKKELKRKEFALEVKTRKLNAKVLEVRSLKRKLKLKAGKLQTMSEETESREKDLDYYTNSIYHKNLKKLLDMKSADCIEPSQLLLLTQLKFMFAKAYRWPESVLRECNLLQAESPHGYRTILERKLVNLPSKKTLQRCTGPAKNETGASNEQTLSTTKIA